MEQFNIIGVSLKQTSVIYFILHMTYAKSAYFEMC